MSGTTGTPRTQAYLLNNEFQDQPGTAGGHSSQQMRDLTVSTVNVAQVRNAQTANYTLAITDITVCVEMNSTSALTVTIPPNSSVAFPVGAWVDVYAANTGQISLVAGAGVTIVTPSTLILTGRYATVRAQQRATDVWVLSGELQPMAVVNAQRVGDFLNSIAVSTQISAYETPYADRATLLSNLQYIGATAIREHLATTAGDAFVVGTYNYLAANGMQLLLLAPTIEDAATLTIADCITAATNVSEAVTNALIGLELPNEPTNSNYTYAGSTSSPSASPGFLPITNFAAAYYTAIKQNAYLNSIPIVSSTLCGGDVLDDGLQWLTVPYGYSHVTLTTSAVTTASAVLHFTSTTGVQVGAYVYVAGLNNGVALGTVVSIVANTSVTISASTTQASGTQIRFGARVPDGTIIADIASLHVYPMYGDNFGSGGVFSAQSIDPALAGGGNYLTQQVKDNFSAPIGAGNMIGPSFATAMSWKRWVTEFGYSTGGITTNGFSVDQATQGKNILTALLNSWQFGFTRLFLYQLTDDTTTPNQINSFGLFTFTWAAKSAATWLHNFVTVLADVGFNRNSFSANSLGYTLTNMPSPGGSSMLFQSSNGTFFLVLWNNKNNWNVATGAPIAIGGTSVTIAFQREGSINVYDPTVSTASQQAVTGNVVTVSLADYPMIISFI